MKEENGKVDVCYQADSLEYKELIIEMVHKINDALVLKKIYTFIKVWIE